MKERILALVLYVISLLPFWILYRISDLLFVLIYYVFGYRKKVVLENLHNSFPEKSEAEIQKIARRFFRYLPDIIVETVKGKSISRKQVMKRVELLNPEVVYQYLEQGRGVMGVTAHYGNWELGIHRLAIMTELPRLVIYKPLSDKSFGNVLNAIRSRFGVSMVPMKQILRHLVNLKNQPQVSIFVADQTPGYQDSDYYTSFLGQDTLVFTGTERIAKSMDLPVVFFEIKKKARRGYYSCKFTTLVEHPRECADREIIHKHTAFTEQIIRNEPAYWLWSHRRWKRKKRQ
ncbi:lysophospholipid acyltransferase family protein [Sphingobacterium sp. lm-10]|uniref:lysophospholipid acyltransferase family protein n=1 Tax=Sphingobacterium sp. lm-10 TaxID=2944904 RepID=UPI0020214CE3|nr:lysophospholipid acyltransferase family protein [Sphingobacterium sp. lm-10]MCL7986799.1 lysophospholipid acyltransferase family protein [Sphingobacterium sp. lm-10]